MSIQYKNIKKLALGIVCFEGTEHLANIISELRESVDYVVIGLQRLSYHGDPIPQIDLNEIFRLRDEDHLVDKIIEIELDTTKAPREQETDKRNLIIQDAQDNGCTHILVIDSDEYYTRKAFEAGCAKIDENDYEMTYCQYVNYYHDYKHFLVYPFKQGMYVPFVTKVQYRFSFECTDFTLPSDPTRRYVRPYDRIDKVKDSEGKEHDVKHYTVQYHVFPWNEVKMHHLSWLRADIRKKLNMWSSKKCFPNFIDLIDKAVMSWKNFDPYCAEAKALMLFNTPGNVVDVKAFPKQYIHPQYDFNTRLRPCREYKKLLVLSMSAANIPIFKKLDETCKQTWMNVDHEKYPNIQVEYWTYTDCDPGEKEIRVDRENHVIYIPTDYEKERFYQTYSKTILALREIKKLGIKYDYMIRTNNSTWINIPLLNEFLAWQTDDSLIFAGRLYGCFWSAFNLYASGELMIWHNRTVDIIDAISGDKIFQLEKAIEGCDDNLIGGLLNKRFLQLGLKQSDFLHSVGDEQFIEMDLPDEIDFSCPAMQIKTYGVSMEDRIKYDPDKMVEINEAWKNNNEDIFELCKKMLENHYDKMIYVIPHSKQEYNAMTVNDEKITLKFKYPKTREDGLKYLRLRQAECKYEKTLI